MTIAVYGATGYTGRLVVAELRRRGLAAVLVGRDEARLKTVDSDSPIRVAGLDEATEAFKGCAAVINCAGPFVRWGAPVVAAAIAAGIHYVDVSGEQDHLARAFAETDASARAAGVTVLPGANDDALPSDLLAHLVAAELTGPIEELVIALQLSRGAGLPSGGTLRSALANAESFGAGGVSYLDGQWLGGVPARRAVVPFGGVPTPVSPFALPAVVTVPRHVEARYVGALAPTELATGFLAVTPELAELRGNAGPTPDERAAGRWTLVVEAVGPDGRRVSGTVAGPDGYGLTAVIAVEAARRLVEDGAPAGVPAPAQAFDPATFLDALAPHDVHWSVSLRPTDS
jgi:short subunit dehydrogenase-like uncharacterized protein